MKLLVGALLWLGAVVSFAADRMEIKLPSGATQFEVLLPENPTTGYKMLLKKYDKSLFRLASDKYIAPKTRLIGGSGNHLFIFTILKKAPVSGQSILEFSYIRPWEASRGTTKQVLIKF